MESRIPVEILGLLRWIARDSDLVISPIACLVGRGAGSGVVRFLAEGKLDLEFLKIRGAGTTSGNYLSHWTTAREPTWTFSGIVVKSSL